MSGKITKNNKNLFLNITSANLQQFKSLHRICAKDKSLIQNAVLNLRPNSSNYEDSWGYVIQATRNDGFKWYDPSTKTLVFFGRKSDSSPIIVIPTFFAEPNQLKTIVTNIQDLLKSPQTILKNIDPRETNQYIKYGFKPYTQHQCWSPEVKYDDQTFPQLIIDLSALEKAQGKRYHKLKNVLNHYPNFKLRRYKSFDKDAVLDLLAEKDGVLDNPTKRPKGQYYISHYMYLSATIDKFVVTKDKKIVGFTATSDISPTNTALVAAIFKHGSKELAPWGIYQTLIYKYKRGAKIANLGGSETQGTHEFKRQTFQPIELRYRTHLVLNN